MALTSLPPVNHNITAPVTTNMGGGLATSSSSMSSGGGSNLGSGIASAAMGAVSLAGEAVTNLQNNSEAKNAQSQFVAGNSFDQIASNYNGYKPYDFGWEHPFWEGFKGSHKSGLTGAAAGSNFGPWGTLIGAVAGSFLGGFTGTFGARKRNKQGREAEEKFNTLDMNRFEGNADQVRQDNIGQSMVNYAAFGGKLNTNGGNFSSGLTEINAGGMHEQNPFGGIQQGVDSNGTPNMVEEGETILTTKGEKKAFSNRLQPEEYLLVGAGLPKSFTKKTFAEASKVLGKITKERPNDAIANRTLDAMGGRLFTAQETQKQNLEMEQNINSQVEDMGLNKLMFASGGKIHITPSKKGVKPKDILLHDFSKDINEYAFGGELTDTVGMISPAIANLGILLNAASSKASSFRTPRMSNSLKLDENIPYEPLDTNYLSNIIGSSAAGSRRALLNTAGGNRATASALISGADYGLGNSIGDMYMKARENNTNKLITAKQFKNQARQANAQLGMAEQEFNSKAALQDYQINTANQSAKSQAVRDGILALSQNFSDTTAYNKRLKTLGNMYQMYDTFGNFKG